jgi:hypothetical protein
LYIFILFVFLGVETFANGARGTSGGGNELRNGVGQAS